MSCIVLCKPEWIQKICFIASNEISNFSSALQGVSIAHWIRFLASAPGVSHNLDTGLPGASKFSCAIFLKFHSGKGVSTLLLGSDSFLCISAMVLIALTEDYIAGIVLNKALKQFSSLSSSSALSCSKIFYSYFVKKSETNSAL